MKLHASSLGIAILYDLVPKEDKSRRVVEIRLVTPGPAGEAVAKSQDTIYSCSYSLDPKYIGRDAALCRAQSWARAACVAPTTYLGAFPTESAIWQ